MLAFVILKSNITKSSFAQVLYILFLFQLRMFETELGVEDVVRNRTQTAFNEKCRDHFNIGNQSWQNSAFSQEIVS